MLENAGRCMTSNGSVPALLDTITQAGFAAYDMLLYLDTHPTDQEAMKYYLQQSGKKAEAEEQYVRRYGPLCQSQIRNADSELWKWTMQPWPWEIKKGRC